LAAGERVGARGF